MTLLLLKMPKTENPKSEEKANRSPLITFLPLLDPRALTLNHGSYQEPLINLEVGFELNEINFLIDSEWLPYLISPSYAVVI
jgi:hypothetical protein